MDCSCGSGGCKELRCVNFWSNSLTKARWLVPRKERRGSGCFEVVRTYMSFLFVQIFGFSFVWPVKGVGCGPDTNPMPSNALSMVFMVSASSAPVVIGRKALASMVLMWMQDRTRIGG